LPRIDRICATPRPVLRGDGTVFAGRGYVADRWLTRLLGLLGTRRLAPDELLWIPRCGRVHTWGMGMPISCAFLDADGVVERVVDPVPAWRVVGAGGARIVVEGPVGMCRALRVGERLSRQR
jgi:uncharacterized protein